MLQSTAKEVLLLAKFSPSACLVIDVANISLQATACKLRLQVPSQSCRSAAPELNRYDFKGKP